jgi:hypothetical protein
MMTTVIAMRAAEYAGVAQVFNPAIGSNLTSVNPAD